MPSPTSESAPGKSSHAALALTLLTTLNLVNYLDRYVLPGVQPIIQHDFSLSDDQIGTLSSAFFFVYMFAAPLTGWLGDRYPRKPLLIVGGLIWSVATLLTATVHTYHELLFRHAIVGIGEASFCIFAPALISDLYAARDRNRVLSIFYVAIPVGAALGYLVGGMLGQRFGWRNPFYVAAIPGLLATLLLWWKVPEPVRGACDAPADIGIGSHRETVLGLARNKAYLLAVFGMAMWTFSIGGISIWMPTFRRILTFLCRLRSRGHHSYRRHRRYLAWRLAGPTMAPHQPSRSLSSVGMELSHRHSGRAASVLRSAIRGVTCNRHR
jgi:multidrug resistance protein